MEQETEGSHAGQPLIRELLVFALFSALLRKDVTYGEPHQGSARLTTTISSEAI